MRAKRQRSSLLLLGFALMWTVPMWLLRTPRLSRRTRKLQTRKLTWPQVPIIKLMPRTNWRRPRGRLRRHGKPATARISLRRWLMRTRRLRKLKTLLILPQRLHPRHFRLIHPSRRALRSPRRPQAHHCLIRLMMTPTLVGAGTAEVRIRVAGVPIPMAVGTQAVTLDHGIREAVAIAVVGIPADLILEAGKPHKLTKDF